MADVGLGYLSLGQPLTTLSGRKRKRLKLATHMSDKGGIYVLDEPTTGLHLADIENLLGLLDRLVDAGKSVIVIEHRQAVMAHADWTIDLGPGAGHEGGRIVFEGTPADLVDRALNPHLAIFIIGRPRCRVVLRDRGIRRTANFSLTRFALTRIICTVLRIRSHLSKVGHNARAPKIRVFCAHSPAPYRCFTSTRPNSSRECSNSHCRSERRTSPFCYRGRGCGCCCYRRHESLSSAGA
ncbi:MAG TPA: hypothetical protein VEY93_09280 [Longimicrobium sp.]|nr:hypothetical protein [Longimicrobium sp.]